MKSNTVDVERSSIVLREVDSILPYARNARTHSDAQVAQIAASIKEFGFNNPILIRGDAVVAGHGRLLAARKLGLAAVPTINLAHLSETQARAYVLADNQLAMNAGWDSEMLALELVELQSAGVDLDMLGFPDLDALLAPAAPAGLLPGADPDAVPEPPKVPVTKPGDIITLGRHRLMCGDSTNAEDVARLMGGERAAICITSPPYNAGAIEQDGNPGTGKKYLAHQDDMTVGQYTEFLRQNMECILAVSDICFYNIQVLAKNRPTIVDLMARFKPNFKDVIYWVKSTGAPHIQPGVMNSRVELVLAFDATENPTRAFPRAAFSQGTCWNIVEGPNAGGNEFAAIHKATFPVYFPEWFITRFCQPGDIVLDTFGGTGTTLIAAEAQGREARLMELDPIYCDVIVTRWENATGQKAVRQ